MKSTYNVEFAGNQIESKEVIARAKKVWVDAGNKNRKVKDLKTMDLYLKPEENAVYYVFNEEESGSFPLYEQMNSDLPQAKETPTVNKRTYICDFSRGGLNTRLYTLVFKPCSEATNIGYFIYCELS